MRILTFTLFSILLTSLFSCKKIEGCTDPTASNFDSDANKDCEFCCIYVIDGDPNQIDDTGNVNPNDGNPNDNPSSTSPLIGKTWYLAYVKNKTLSCQDNSVESSLNHIPDDLNSNQLVFLNNGTYTTTTIGPSSTTEDTGVYIYDESQNTLFTSITVEALGQTITTERLCEIITLNNDSLELFLTTDNCDQQSRPHIITRDFLYINQ